MIRLLVSCSEKCLKGNKERWGYFEKYGEILYDGIKQVMGRIIEGDWKGRVGRQRVSLQERERIQLKLDKVNEVERMKVLCDLVLMYNNLGIQSKSVNNGQFFKRAICLELLTFLERVMQGFNNGQPIHQKKIRIFGNLLSKVMILLLYGIKSCEEKQAHNHKPKHKNKK